MKRLFIAEKPSLGRAIADALPQPQRRHEGYIEAATGDVVTWCFGHLLEQVDPHIYDERFKRWNIGDLPIVPAAWQLAPRTAARKQLATIRRLVKNAEQLVHAGDPDREGQLLVDEVLEYLNVSAARRKQVQRLLISDLNPKAVKRALGVMRPNSEFAPLSSSALARSRADWLYGINLTRAYTLLGQRAGYKGVLSVGRVQTPVLGLVVRRDEEIANFTSKPFYEVIACIPHAGNDIRATWKPSEACASYQDSEGRVVHLPLAQNVAARIACQPATLIEAEHKSTKEAPPLPFSLSALQIDAAKRFGLSAKSVLEIAQSLYEKHKAITYPRSDCRHLPSEHFTQASEICEAIGGNAPALATIATTIDTSRKSKAWNDKKVGAHHAIIPTPRRVGQGAFSRDEARIYELISRQYLMQFCQPATYARGRLVFKIGTGTFVASGKDLLSQGWIALRLKGRERTQDDKAPAYLPNLETGTVLSCREGQIVTKKTEPPKAFTDATILQAMTGIARLVTDKDLRKILRDTDGLGTEATRASILEVLFTRQLLARKGKAICATPMGQGLIRALPAMATQPDMTAHWERRLRDIASKRDAYDPFMAQVEAQLAEMLQSPKRGEIPQSLRHLPAPTAPPKARKTPTKRNSRTSKSAKPPRHSP